MQGRYKNLVNVIFQNTFMISDINKGYEFLDKCFESFDNNNYPIIGRLYKIANLPIANYWQTDKIN